jgi:hypothetical protein
MLVQVKTRAEVEVRTRKDNDRLRKVQKRRLRLTTGKDKNSLTEPQERAATKVER